MGEGLPYRERVGRNFTACDKSLASTAIHRTWNLVWRMVYVRTWLQECKRLIEAIKDYREYRIL